MHTDTRSANRTRRKRVIFALGPIPQIIGRIPRPYPQGELLGALVTRELEDIWKSLLSDSELRELREPQSISATTLDKLDALILRQAETMGWRLGLSPLVHQRFEKWDFQANGPKLFERYGKALAKSARIFQKRELPPIDDPDCIALNKRPSRNCGCFCEI